MWRLVPNYEREEMTEKIKWTPGREWDLVRIVHKHKTSEDTTSWAKVALDMNLPESICRDKWRQIVEHKLSSEADLIECPVCGALSPVRQKRARLWEWHCRSCTERSYPFASKETLLNAYKAGEGWLWE